MLTMVNPELISNNLLRISWTRFTGVNVIIIEQPNITTELSRLLGCTFFRKFFSDSERIYSDLKRTLSCFICDICLIKCDFSIYCNCIYMYRCKIQAEYYYK